VADVEPDEREPDVLGLAEPEVVLPVFDSVVRAPAVAPAELWCLSGDCNAMIATMATAMPRRTTNAPAMRSRR